MKKLVELKEVDNEGLIGLLGKNVLVFCMNYIYTGKISGVNTHDILLEDPRIVYQTGSFESKSFEDAQRLSRPLYIRVSGIESYFETDKT